MGDGTGSNTGDDGQYMQEFPQILCKMSNFVTQKVLFHFLIFRVPLESSTLGKIIEKFVGNSKKVSIS